MWHNRAVIQVGPKIGTSTVPGTGTALGPRSMVPGTLGHGKISDRPGRNICKHHCLGFAFVPMGMALHSLAYQVPVLVLEEEVYQVP